MKNNCDNNTAGNASGRGRSPRILCSQYSKQKCDRDHDCANRRYHSSAGGAIVRQQARALKRLNADKVVQIQAEEDAINQIVPGQQQDLQKILNKILSDRLPDVAHVDDHSMNDLQKLATDSSTVSQTSQKLRSKTPEANLTEQLFVQATAGGENDFDKLSLSWGSEGAAEKARLGAQINACGGDKDGRSKDTPMKGRKHKRDESKTPKKKKKEDRRRKHEEKKKKKKKEKKQSSSSSSSSSDSSSNSSKERPFQRQREDEDDEEESANQGEDQIDRNIEQTDPVGWLDTFSSVPLLDLVGSTFNIVLKQIMRREFDYRVNDEEGKLRQMHWQGTFQYQQSVVNQLQQGRQQTIYANTMVFTYRSKVVYGYCAHIAGGHLQFCQIIHRYLETEAFKNASFGSQFIRSVFDFFTRDVRDVGTLELCSFLQDCVKTLPSLFNNFLELYKHEQQTGLPATFIVYLSYAAVLLTDMMLRDGQSSKPMTIFSERSKTATNFGEVFEQIQGFVNAGKKMGRNSQYIDRRNDDLLAKIRTSLDDEQSPRMETLNEFEKKVFGYISAQMLLSKALQGMVDDTRGVYRLEAQENFNRQVQNLLQEGTDVPMQSITIGAEVDLLKEYELIDFSSMSNSMTQLYCELQANQTWVGRLNLVKEYLDEAAMARMIGERVGDQVIPGNNANAKLWRRQLRKTITQSVCQKFSRAQAVIDFDPATSVLGAEACQLLVSNAGLMQKSLEHVADAIEEQAKLMEKHISNGCKGEVKMKQTTSNINGSNFPMYEQQNQNQLLEPPIQPQVQPSTAVPPPKETTGNGQVAPLKQLSQPEKPATEKKVVNSPDSLFEAKKLKDKQEADAETKRLEDLAKVSNKQDDNSKLILNSQESKSKVTHTKTRIVKETTKSSEDCLDYLVTEEIVDGVTFMWGAEEWEASTKNVQMLSKAKELLDPAIQGEASKRIQEYTDGDAGSVIPKRDSQKSSYPEVQEENNRGSNNQVESKISIPETTTGIKRSHSTREKLQEQDTETELDESDKKREQKKLEKRAKKERKEAKKLKKLEKEAVYTSGGSSSSNTKS